MVSSFFWNALLHYFEQSRYCRSVYMIYSVGLYFQVLSFMGFTFNSCIISYFFKSVCVFNADPLYT